MQIVAATDLSSASEPALRYAVDLAEKLGAELTLLHSVAPPIYPILDGAVIPSAQQLAELMVEEGCALDELRGTLARDGLAIRTKLVTGNAADSIVRYAKDAEADLIVIGTHGRTGWRHALLGSVAEHVVRSAPVPVLTIPAAKDGALSMFESPPIL